MNTNRDPCFEQYVRDACGKHNVGAYFGMALLFFLGLFFVVYAIKLFLFPLMIPGLLFWGGIALIFYRFRGQLKSGDYWVDLLVNQPQKIIWVKPVNVRHTAYYVVTLFQESHFHLLSSDGASLDLKCDSDASRRVFFNGIRRYIPYAHIGYSPQVQYCYDNYRNQFIQALQQNNIYNPVMNLQG